ncbi:methyl-accepting chemotaxis protein [Limisalsivibrio acetivorans]|uniref:methyl-accepting chemotaxis protein n=1 Tax=Limisalsivibrio acetivorans TaxID=1304888 RepID=UPI0003B33E7E|nr:methyl-accepting chemotaxis protein [Limisalsivibrio acetivorans]
MSLKIKIFIVMLVIFLASSIILISQSYFGTKSIADSMLLERQQNISGDIANYVDSWAELKMHAIDSISNIIEKNAQPGIPRTERLRQAMKVVEVSSKFDLVYVGVEQTGEFIPSSPINLPDGYDPRQRPWYTGVKGQKKVSATKPYASAEDGRLIISFMKPFYLEGNFEGVVASDISLDSVVQNVLSRKIGETGFAFITNKEGTILIHPDEGMVLEKGIADINEQLTGLAGTNETEEIDINGKRSLVSNSSIPIIGWQVWTVVPKKEVYGAVSAMSYKQITTGVIILIIAVVVILFFTRTLLRPIDRLLASLMDIAEGEADLTQRLDENRSDELGSIAKYFNMFISRIQEIIHTVADLSNAMADSSSELSNSVTNISGGLSQQSGDTNELAAAVEEMNQTIQQIAENASNTAEQANNTLGSAEQSQEAVMGTVEKVNEIAQFIRESARVIESVGESSGKIGEIVDVINDIADQTNLLALNAAIEAARAGEAGRGFAVVADEVRKLAERTQTATQEISQMISELQSSSQKAVSKVEGGVKHSEEGTEQANRAGESIVQIIENTNITTDMVTQIATAAEEQSATTNEISSTVERIRHIAETNDTELREISSASGHVSEYAAKLREEVQMFKIK